MELTKSVQQTFTSFSPDNGHQIPYQPYAGAYNTHYPPPDAFAAYGPPPPGGYAPQNLSYAPPAHQNYPHHQNFPPQQQTQLHMPQTHLGELQRLMGRYRSVRAVCVGFFGRAVHYVQLFVA